MARPHSQIRLPPDASFALASPWVTAGMRAVHDERMRFERCGHERLCIRSKSRRGGNVAREGVEFTPRFEVFDLPMHTC